MESGISRALSKLVGMRPPAPFALRTYQGSRVNKMHPNRPSPWEIAYFWRITFLAASIKLFNAVDETSILLNISLSEYLLHVL